MEPYPHRIPTPAEDPALWANRDGQIIRASVVLVLLPTVFVALRLCSRWKAGAGFWVGLSWGLAHLNWKLTSRAVGRFERGIGNGAQNLQDEGAKSSAHRNQMFSWSLSVINLLGMLLSLPPLLYTL